MRQPPDDDWRAAAMAVPPGGQATVPAGVLFAGVPGRVVRDLTDQDRMSFAHTSAHYVGRPARHRAASWREIPDS